MEPGRTHKPGSTNNCIVREASSRMAKHCTPSYILIFQTFFAIKEFQLILNCKLKMHVSVFLRLNCSKNTRVFLVLFKLTYSFSFKLASTIDEHNLPHAPTQIFYFSAICGSYMRASLPASKILRADELASPIGAKSNPKYANFSIHFKLYVIFMYLGIDVYLTA